jgi:hypothetical protein
MMMLRFRHCSFTVRANSVVNCLVQGVTSRGSGGGLLAPACGSAVEGEGGSYAARPLPVGRFRRFAPRGMASYGRLC